MQVSIKRNNQKFGPYPATTIQLYLEQGSLLPHDLARLDTESDTDWRPLSKLMRQHNIASPVLSGLYRPSRVLEELRSFDFRLLFPWIDIRSGRWLKDRRVLLFVGVGMLPVVLISIGPSVALVYWCISLYFAAIWAMYFYQMFRTPEVSPKTAAICFGVTGAVAIPVLLVLQQLPPMSFLYEMARSPNVLARFAGMFFGVGIAEESCKAAIVYYFASRPGRVFLPQTVVLYGMISGLGFGSVEGVFYQQGVNREAPADMGYFLNVLRLTSLPFLHAVWAGISAYFLSFSMVVPRKRLGLRAVAILIPAVFHGSYNTAISTPGAGLLGLVAATISVFFLMSYLASCKELKAQLTGAPGSP